MEKSKINTKIKLKEIPISINIRKVLIVILLFISVIILDIILRVCFLPIKMTLSKEDYTSYETAINFLQFSSSLVNGYIFIAISLIIYLFCNKLKFFIIVSAYYSTDIFCQLLKIIYQIPREAWSDNFRIENCVGLSGGFANPSGHSLTSIFFSFASSTIDFPSGVLSAREANTALLMKPFISA